MRERTQAEGTGMSDDGEFVRGDLLAAHPGALRDVGAAPDRGLAEEDAGERRFTHLRFGKGGPLGRGDRDEHPLTNSSGTDLPSGGTAGPDHAA